MMTAIMQTPTAQIPLNIPYPMPVQHLNLVQPPPLPQLKPYGIEPTFQQVHVQQVINTTTQATSIQNVAAPPVFQQVQIQNPGPAPMPQQKSYQQPPFIPPRIMSR